jgi:RNA polymerase sigma-70 factor (ECF subfamily)
MPVGSDTQLQGLIDLAKTGDHKAKTLLLDHSCERLLKLTRRMFRGYSSLRRWEATDDVFQNALIRLHRALSQVEVDSVRHFFNLAAVQIRRELLDLKKHHFGLEGSGSHHHTDQQSPDEAGGSLSSATEEEPADLGMWAEFHSAVERLPAELREVVGLVYYEGLAQEEAAELLDLSPRTLKRRWQDAKLKLQEQLCEQPQ